MKYGIPLGALVLIALGVWFHRPVAAPFVPERHPAAAPGNGVRERSAENRTLELPGAPETPGKSEPLAERPAEASAPPKSPSAAPADWRKVLVQLENTLGLGSLQLPEVERILRQRQEQIRTCHDGIRKFGVLDIRAYEWEVRRMKEEWYRSIDVVLDRGQHERFVALVEGGLFNEGLAFTVEPGMTVLE